MTGDRVTEIEHRLKVALMMTNPLAPPEGQQATKAKLIDVDVPWLLAELADARAKLAAVEALHATKFYDKYGREDEEAQGYGGWCIECGRFTKSACPTIAALHQGEQS